MGFIRQGLAGWGNTQVDGESCNVVYCSSGLQVREALVSMKAPHPNPLPPGEGTETVAEPLLVVITLLMRRSSGSMCWRAWLGGSYTVSITGKWCATSFMLARSTHASRRRHGSPRHCYSISRRGYPPVASGLLDADTVWKHLLTQCLALPDGRPDAVTLLTWSLSGPNLRRYEALSGEFRTALRQRVQDTAGAVGVAMLDALDAGHGALLVPIGLVCDILFSPGGQRQIEIAQARARLEPYLAGRLPSSEVGRAWAAAAASALAALPTSQRHDWLARAEQLLTDLKASEYSALSTVLRSGWQQRLSHFAAALQSFLHGKVTLDQLEERLNHVACHQEAAQQGARMERVRMALRLARYLRTHPEQELSVTLAHASRLYAEHGGYVDWARRYLLSGDETADLAAALACWRTASDSDVNTRISSLLPCWQPGRKLLASQRVCCPSNRPSRRLLPGWPGPPRSCSWSWMR